jgi:hypothetical protein
MNPSYVRIRLPMAEALPRFSEWIGLPPLGPPTPVQASQVVEAACEKGRWRSPVGVFVYESGGWTVFDDLTGHLASVSAERWSALAGADELVLAGYNDAVPYGQLIAVRAGRVTREFLDDRQDPRQNVNRGQLAVERRSPIKDWVGAASFVDSDEIASHPGTGLLWMFG